MEVPLYIWLLAFLFPILILFLSLRAWKEWKRFRNPTLEDRYKIVRELEEEIQKLERLAGFNR